MKKPYDVFISYAVEDETLATAISDELQFRGVSVWFAPLTLKFGDKLLDSINTGIASSECGLLILSPTYIKKKWTSHELDILHRQHIENDKKLFPLWHGIDKAELDAWNLGISGIFAMNSKAGAEKIAKGLAEVVYKNSPSVGVVPIYENPQWRFLQGKGELYKNRDRGAVFHLFEAALMPDEEFPLYVYDRPYAKKEIILAVARAIYYDNPDVIKIGAKERKKMKALCKQHGYDLDDPNFDPAMYG